MSQRTSGRERTSQVRVRCEGVCVQGRGGWEAGARVLVLARARLWEGEGEAVERGERSRLVGEEAKSEGCWRVETIGPLGGTLGAESAWLVGCAGW